MKSCKHSKKARITLSVSVRDLSRMATAMRSHANYAQEQVEAAYLAMTYDNRDKDRLHACARSWRRSGAKAREFAVQLEEITSQHSCGSQNMLPPVVSIR